MRALLLLWSLAPLLWQLRTSLQSPAALAPPATGAAAGAAQAAAWTLENYQLILAGDPPFWRCLVNSGVVGLSTTLLTLLLAIPCAYGLHRQRGRIGSVATLILLAAALFPTVLLFLGLLETARRLGLANNLLALSLPYSAMGLPLAVLLLRSAFDDLPPELEDAAKLEGLDLWQRLRHVLLPLLAPALISTALLLFLFSWNEYPIALTWLSRSELLTLPVAMARIGSSSVFTIPYGAFAAATVLGSLPLLLLVLLGQRWIVSGLTQGAIKG
jgi:multiple sugar transport system permease protein